MPTSSTDGGSVAPMANSPPGIHTSPGGEGAGTGAVLGMVGPKAAAPAASVGGPASTLLAAERGHGRNTAATATAAKAIISEIKIHPERMSAKSVPAVC